MDEEINKRYAELAGAILKQAADDYIEALETCARLEEFFLSKWGQFLSMNHGEAIIRNCHRIAAENKRDTMSRNE